MWKTLVFDFEKGASMKSHLSTLSIHGPLCRDLESRHGVVKLTEDYGDPAFFEVYGGPCLVDRPLEDFTVDGNILRVPCDNVGGLLNRLEENPLRIFEDGSKYYKIHGPYWCLVLTPEERDSLLNQCRKIVESAEERANAFVEQWERRFGSHTQGSDFQSN